MSVSPRELGLVRAKYIRPRGWMYFYDEHRGCVEYGVREPLDSKHPAHILVGYDFQWVADIPEDTYVYPSPTDPLAPRDRGAAERALLRFYGGVDREIRERWESLYGVSL